METIKLTPESVETYFLIGKPAVISISRAMIDFSPGAAAKLDLRKGSRFTLHIKNGTLYYRDETKEGFEIKNISKYGNMKAYAKGVLGALKANKVITEFKNTRFDIDTFEEGMWKLKQREK